MMLSDSSCSYRNSQLSQATKQVVVEVDDDKTLETTKRFDV